MVNGAFDFRKDKPNLGVQKDTQIAFFLFLIYLISFFIRLPSRIPVLGVVRFDFILVGIISFLIFSNKSKGKYKLDDSSRYLLAILIYSVITLPLVEWPGSVINNGIVSFIKGSIFYFFTVNLITSTVRLKWIVGVFISCNLVRILEPLFLNLTTGYLGSATHLGSGDFAGRLSGAPADTINPNGLAFVIATVIPFLHYVLAPSGKKGFSIYLILMPLLFYTMVLTLSRSGVLALAIIAIGIWIKSSRKTLLILLGVVGLTAISANLNDVQKDRYLSIVSDDARQSATAQGRLAAWASDFKVALNRPIIGHGLGTSREANWNVAGKDQVSHILWAEIWQEIGLIGFVLFLLYLLAMIKNFREASGLIRHNLSSNEFLYRVNKAMQVWLLMNLLFSFASYGLKSYEWYLFGGLSVALLNSVRAQISKNVHSPITKEGEARQDRFPLARKIR